MTNEGMNHETLIFIIAVSGAIISILVVIVIGLISWTYQKDLSEKSRRIEFLESQVLAFKNEWMGRPETQGLVNRVEQEFSGRHDALGKIVSSIAESVSDLRAMVGEQRLSWTQQLHTLGDDLNKTVAAQIEKCSAALMKRVDDQLKLMRHPPDVDS